MPRKSKNEELKKWLSEATAVNANIIYSNYSFVVTLVLLDKKSIYQCAKRLREIYPDSIHIDITSESKRVHI